MKLDRNINGDGRGKYGLILNRELARAKDIHSPQGLTEIEYAINILEHAGIIEWGGPHTENEFFVIKLKDKYAGGALHTYASYAVRDGEIEYGQDVMELAKRSGEFHSSCKKPD
jgi:hypothetical protein